MRGIRLIHDNFRIVGYPYFGRTPIDYSLTVLLILIVF